MIANLGIFEKVNSNANANNVLPTIHAKYLYHLHPEEGEHIKCLSWDMRCQEDKFVAIDALEPEAFTDLVDLEHIEINNADMSNDTFYSYNGMLYLSSSPATLICCPQKYFHSHTAEDLQQACMQAHKSLKFGDYAFYNVTFPDLEFNLFDNIVAIGDCAFSNSSVNRVSIGSDLATIGMYAFANCSDLTYIDLADTTGVYHLRIIPRGAFYNCQTLKEVIIPEGVIYIGDKAFANCKSLSRVFLPNSLSCICKDAFSGCGEVELVLPTKLPLARYGSQLTKIGTPEYMYLSGEPNLDIQPNRMNTHLEFYRNNYSVCKSSSISDIGEGVKFTCNGELPAVVQRLQV